MKAFKYYKYPKLHLEICLICGGSGVRDCTRTKEAAGSSPGQFNLLFLFKQRHLVCFFISLVLTYFGRKRLRKGSENHQNSNYYELIFIFHTVFGSISDCIPQPLYVKGSELTIGKLFFLSECHFNAFSRGFPDPKNTRKSTGNQTENNNKN